VSRLSIAVVVQQSINLDGVAFRAATARLARILLSENELLVAIVS